MKSCFAVIGSILTALAVFPSAALADVAESGFGEAAATEITLIIPQATIIGVAVIGVLGVIVAIMTVISMMKYV